MRTLTSTLAAELGLTITRPGYLVEVGFASPRRMSTIGDVMYGGQIYLADDVRVGGLSVDGSAAQNGTLAFGNSDDAIGALILNEGIADRAVRILAVYAGAPDDAVDLFAGVADDAEWDKSGRITVRLVDADVRTAFWPRRFINAASGFNHLTPAGTRLSIGGTTFILERT